MPIENIGMRRCEVTGATSKGVTISCENEEVRDEVAINLLHNLPRFSAIKAGTPDSMVIEHDDLFSGDVDFVEYHNTYIPYCVLCVR